MGRWADPQEDRREGRWGDLKVDRTEGLKVDRTEGRLVLRLQVALRAQTRGFRRLFQRTNVAKSVPQHVVELGRFFIVSCFFRGRLSFGHGGTHFTDMARLK